MSDADLLKDIREKFAYDTGEWKDIRDEGATDMRYIAGDTWEKKERDAREAAGRPVINMDELSQHVNQLINDVRQNKRAIKVSQAGDGATDQTAEFRANKIREIEYRSHAQEAYTTAFENAVQRGYGYFRITTKEVSDDSFDQELWIEPIYNPDLVTPDANALKSTASDMQHCTVHEAWLESEFKRKFPDARIRDFSPEVRNSASGWFKQGKGGAQVMLAEHWVITSKRRKLLLLKPPPAPVLPGRLPDPNAKPEEPLHVFEDELPKTVQLTDAMVLRRRDVEVKAVVQYLTNGVEILKTNPWAGQWIPIVAMYGKVLYVDAGAGVQRRMLSMIRLARGAAMLYNYYRTTEAELVGMTPKTPYMAYAGQFSPDQLVEVQKSLHEPVAVLFANPKIEGVMDTLPLPVRQPYVPAIEPLEVGAESARRGIMSAIGSTPLPTQAQRRNEKSGVALKHMEDTAARGSFHFVDHYEDALRHAGVILDDLMPKIYDTARELSVRKPNNDAQMIQVNSPGGLDTKQGRHDVTISTGPAFESEREAESDFADTLMGTNFAPLIADLAVKLKGGGPILDEMADRLTPPQFRKPKEGEGPDPRQMMQALGQAKQETQQLKTLLSQISLELKTKKIEQQTKVRISEMEIASKEKIAGLQAVTAVKTADIKAGVDETIAQLEADIARAEAMLDVHRAALDRSHEVGMAVMGHVHGADQADQGQEHALEQTQQAADLAPPPADDTGAEAGA